MTRTFICLVLLTLFSAAGETQSPRPPQSAIPGVIAEGARVELVRGGFKGLEGPVPTPDGGLYFTALEENRIYKLAADGAISVWRENTKRANGLFVAKDGRVFAAESTVPQIAALTPDGRATQLAAQSAGKPLRGPNDLIADSKGGIYFTDPAPRPGPNLAPKEPGNVHYLRPNGEVLLLDAEIRRPNGITLSLDEKTLYVDDTEGEYVYAFDVSPTAASPTSASSSNCSNRKRVRWDCEAARMGWRSIPWAALYVATAAGIQVIDSGGRHLGIIRVPMPARNVAFAGPGRKTLYMTALETLYRVPMVAEGPAGRAK